MSASVFHVELRQFPHTARTFNLTPNELRARFTGPWTVGGLVDFDDRRWAPDRSKITIYESRPLRPEEFGIGRGWPNVTRLGDEVTERELSAARAVVAGTHTPGSAAPGRAAAAAGPAGAGLATVKDQLVALCEAGPIPISQALALVSGANPGARVSERLAVAERAVWELLHEQRLALLRAGDAEPVASEQWQALLLAWPTWAESPSSVLLQRSGTGPRGLETSS